jgi:hypothetical protein
MGAWEMSALAASRHCEWAPGVGEEEDDEEEEEEEEEENEEENEEDKEEEKEAKEEEAGRGAGGGGCGGGERSSVPVPNSSTKQQPSGLSMLNLAAKPSNAPSSTSPEALTAAFQKAVAEILITGWAAKSPVDS